MLQAKQSELKELQEQYYSMEVDYRKIETDNSSYLREVDRYGRIITGDYPLRVKEHAKQFYASGDMVDSVALPRPGRNPDDGEQTSSSSSDGSDNDEYQRKKREQFHTKKQSTTTTYSSSTTGHGMGGVSQHTYAQETGGITMGVGVGMTWRRTYYYLLQQHYWTWYGRSQPAYLCSGNRRNDNGRRRSRNDHGRRTNFLLFQQQHNWTWSGRSQRAYLY